MLKNQNYGEVRFTAKGWRRKRFILGSAWQWDYGHLPDFDWGIASGVKQEMANRENLQFNIYRITQNCGIGSGARFGIRRPYVYDSACRRPRT